MQQKDAVTGSFDLYMPTVLAGTDKIGPFAIWPEFLIGLPIHYLSSSASIVLLILWAFARGKGK